MFVSIVAACTLFNPLDEYGPAGPRDDAATSADTSADASGPTCARERWPERPTKEDATGDLELVFAVRTLAIGASSDAGTNVTTGFDLDGVCTCPQPASCRPPPDGGSGCDLDGGVDDQGTQALVSIATLGRFANDATKQLGEGRKGLILRLARYNGGLDDSQVELAMFPSLGTEIDDAGERKPPLHDGNDRWTVDRGALLGGNAPPYVPQFVDSNAYVKNGWLVARATAPLHFGELVMSLTAGVVVARVAREGTSYSLQDGRVVGRLPASNLLTEFEKFKDPLSLDGGGLCGDSKLYADLKKRICAAVDLVTDPEKDNTSAACDALGMTVLFSAEQGQLGAPVDRPPTDRYCGSTWTDDCPR
jgi:hypothetical protein